jgi:hypothetical protein
MISRFYQIHTPVSDTFWRFGAWSKMVCNVPIAEAPAGEQKGPVSVGSRRSANRKAAVQPEFRSYVR